NHPAAIALNGDPDVFRAGVERIFNQLFHDRRRPLDHFPSRDLCDYIVGQHVNSHEQLPRRSTAGGAVRTPVLSVVSIIAQPGGIVTGGSVRAAAAPDYRRPAEY